MVDYLSNITEIISKLIKANSGIPWKILMIQSFYRDKSNYIIYVGEGAGANPFQNYKL